MVNNPYKNLYFLWFSRKRILIDLKNNDKKLIENNEDIQNKIEKIYNYCSSNVVEGSKKELLDGEKSSSNDTNSGEKKYTQEIFGRISSDLKSEIFKLAHSEILISTAAKYLKVFPILGKVLLYHNVSNRPEDIRGAMFWHKDDFGYRSLDLFVAITDIDEENGPTNFIDTKDSAKIKYTNKSQNMAGEKGKITEDYFEKHDEINWIDALR